MDTSKTLAAGIGCRICGGWPDWIWLLYPIETSFSIFDWPPPLASLNIHASCRSAGLNSFLDCFLASLSSPDFGGWRAFISLCFLIVLLLSLIDLVSLYGWCWWNPGVRLPEFVLAFLCICFLISPLRLHLSVLLRLTSLCLSVNRLSFRSFAPFYLHSYRPLSTLLWTTIQSSTVLAGV